MDAETLVYALTDRLPVMKEEKVGNMSAKVECKAVLDKLAAREKEVKVHTLGDTLSVLKGLQTLHTLSDTGAENQFESFGDKKVKVNAKALNYQMVDRQAKLKVGKLGDTSQHRK